jgi:putative DNA primase/helicase
MSGFDHLMDKGPKTTPARFTANNFSDLCKAILSHPVQLSITSEMSDEERRNEKQKLYWFSAPTQKAGQRRTVENMAACAFGSLDIDDSTPGAIAALMPVLTRRSVMTYTTASHTADAPRLRIVCELSRSVEPAERGAALTAVETMLMQSAGFTLASLEGHKARWTKSGDYVALDRSVYGAQSYLYCPHKGANVQTYTGAIIDVDALPLPVETPREKKPTSKAVGAKSQEKVADFDDMDVEPDAFVIADLRNALSFTKWQNPSDDYETWVANGVRLASLKGSSYEDDAKALWHEYSARSPEYREDYTERKWDTFNAERSSYRGIFSASQKMGWDNPAKWRLSAQHIEKMAASTRGELLAQYYGKICLKADGNMIYRYTGQGWEHLTAAELQRQLAQLFRDNGATYTPNAIKSAIEAMGMLLPIMGETPLNLIGFKNGVYDLGAGHFRPHCPDDWLTCNNGVEYTSPVPGENMKDHAPNFWRWLHHSATGAAEKMARVKAALFMVLANRYDWQLFIEVTGAGGSGKSVFTGIARMLVGEQNATSGTIEDMDSARERASFVGKSLIVLPDQAPYTGAGAGIKAITGNEAVRIDPKHLHPFETIIRAVVVATNNDPMRFTERQGGISRRRVIFPFNEIVKAEDRDTALLDKVRTELPVIVRCLLAEFAEPDTAKALLNEQLKSREALEVKNSNDPMYGFCSHLVGLPEKSGMYMGNGKMARNPLKYLYHAYLAYLEAYGYAKAPTLNAFSGGLRDTAKAFGITIDSGKDKKGVRFNVTLVTPAPDWLQEFDDEEPPMAL